MQLRAIPDPTDHAQFRHVGGSADRGGPVEVIVDFPASGQSFDLPSGYDNPKMPNHSPDGFQFGYIGSGPSQLAAAMLAYAVGPDNVTERIDGKLAYKAYAHDVLSHLEDGWTIPVSHVQAWFNDHVDT